MNFGYIDLFINITKYGLFPTRGKYLGSMFPNEGQEITVKKIKIINIKKILRITQKV